MDTIECIKTRRSVRKFKPDKISRDTIEKIVDACRWSPSWENTKAVRYHVVNDEHIIQEIAGMMASENVHIVKNAPCVIALSIIKGRAGFNRRINDFEMPRGDSWKMFDTGVVTQTLCLAAHEFGIGTVIMASFDIEKVAELLSIPEDEDLIILIAAGLPDNVPNAPRRKEVNEVLSFVNKNNS